MRNVRPRSYKPTRCVWACLRVGVWAFVAYRSKKESEFYFHTPIRLSEVHLRHPGAALLDWSRPVVHNVRSVGEHVMEGSA